MYYFDVLLSDVIWAFGPKVTRRYILKVLGITNYTKLNKNKYFFLQITHANASFMAFSSSLLTATTTFPDVSASICRWAALACSAFALMTSLTPFPISSESRVPSLCMVKQTYLFTFLMCYLLKLSLMYVLYRCK